MDDFNKQWWLDFTVSPTSLAQRLLAPVRASTSSSGSRPNPITGTQRIPSAFEVAEASRNARSPAPVQSARVVVVQDITRATASVLLAPAR
ncbi:hypothetical protein A4X13_0g5064 [Tilletia indica]|uniref:Uncharacterized protein n=1 Tax=Tilletia indica TaxID=43049 RepID=A0A8T8SWS1_9BASI|nr:hypothetical protein A4X13_0g5064 [Tilletia indica]